MSCARTSYYAFLCFVAFTGCGYIPDAPQAPAPPPATEAAARNQGNELAHTGSLSEARVEKIAAGMIAGGEPLSADLAEACWKRESARPRARAACALAWSKGGEKSTLLAEGLAREGMNSRPLALAAIFRPELLADASLPALLALLTPLRADPPWVRGLAIEGWLASREKPGILEAQLLWQALEVGESAANRLAELDPASAQAVYRLAGKLGLSFDEELLTQFCVPAAGPLAQVRCWRFLSALAGPSLDPKARTFLPQGRESGWVLFERSFPERAQAMRPFR